MRPSSSQQAQGQRHTLQDSEQNKHEALVENSRPWRWRQWSGGPRQAPQRGTRLLAGGPGPHPRTALGRHRAGTAESAPVPTPSRFCPGRWSSQPACRCPPQRQGIRLQFFLTRRSQPGHSIQLLPSPTPTGTPGLSCGRGDQDDSLTPCRAPPAGGHRPAGQVCLCLSPSRCLSVCLCVSVCVPLCVSVSLCISCP